MGGITVQQLLGQFTNGPSGPNFLAARLEDNTCQVPEKMGPSLFAEAEDRTLKKPETVLEDHRIGFIRNLRNLHISEYVPSDTSLRSSMKIEPRRLKLSFYGEPLAQR